MAKPQFSLLRLMGAVTCFAVAFGAWSYGDRFSGIPEWGIWLAILLCIAMPGIAVGLLSGRVWAGTLVAFAIFSYIAVNIYKALNFSGILL